ncbi:hypothetical protein BTH41_00700 [Bacillus mycoides]|nr:hypothetical protein BTH41_00700 [Bacillus mycoides]
MKSIIWSNIKVINNYLEIKEAVSEQSSVFGGFSQLLLYSY